MEIHVSTKRSCSSFLGITHRVLLRHLQNSPLPVHAAERWQPKWSVCCVPEWERLSLNTLWQEEEIVKVLPIRSQTVPEDTNGKEEMATTLTRFFLLPVLHLHSLQKDTHHIHPSSSLWYIYFLPFFQLCTYLCVQSSQELRGEKKEDKAKWQGLRAEIFQVARRNMLYFMSHCLFVLLMAGFRELMEIRRVSPSQLYSPPCLV